MELANLNSNIKNAFISPLNPEKFFWLRWQEKNQSLKGKARGGGNEDVSQSPGIAGKGLGAGGQAEGACLQLISRCRPRIALACFFFFFY